MTSRPQALAHNHHFWIIERICPRTFAAISSRASSERVGSWWVKATFFAWARRAIANRRRMYRAPASLVCTTSGFRVLRIDDEQIHIPRNGTYLFHFVVDNCEYSPKMCRPLNICCGAVHGHLRKTPISAIDAVPIGENRMIH